ncbi:MAG: hypothetical protein ACRDN0_39355, partial [Trebonia sp.]
ATDVVPADVSPAGASPAGASPAGEEPAGRGATLVIAHGPFDTSDAEAEDRAGVREGWEHFLPRLAASLVP